MDKQNPGPIDRDTGDHDPEGLHIFDDAMSDHDRGMGRSQGGLELAPIDHEEYDALADLFLGDGDLAPGYYQDSEVEDMDSQSSVPEVQMSADIDRVQPIESKEIKSQEHLEQDSEPSHETHTPVLVLKRHVEDAVLERIDTSEAKANQLLEEIEQDFERTVSSVSESALQLKIEDDGSESLGHVEMIDDDDVDDQWEEIEWDEEDYAHSQIQVMPRPCVEVVVLGHLPVRASLWARQYACSRARETNDTIALIRSASGSTSVDLITGGEPIETQTYADVDGAIGAVHELADRVILRVDEGHEPELFARSEVDEITVLTGADEAAVVASYRLIKSLDATIDDGSDPDQMPSLRLAVMGARESQASDACEKLKNAVEAFLKRPIEIVIGSSRIDATGTMNIFRDSVVHRARVFLDGLIDHARGELMSLQSLNLDDQDQGDENPALIQDQVVGNEPEFLSLNPEIEQLEERTESETLKEKTRLDNQVESEAEENELEGLCAYIPGLSPIESRCPKAQGVEFGVDSNGHLHAIACDLDLANGTQDAINRLLAAQSWAKNNYGLLLRAEKWLAYPSSETQADLEPMLHLLTSEPRSVKEMYDTSIRVYALARVKLGNTTAQIATPIN